MKYLLTISLFFIYSCVGAQDIKSLEKAVADFNTALMNKDTVMLKKLVHDKLSYGHSNGWVETKQDMLKNLYNGKITYTEFSQMPATITSEDKTAIVRANAHIHATLDGKMGEYNLHIMQVWVQKEKSWQMLSRQSTKND